MRIMRPSALAREAVLAVALTIALQLEYRHRLTPLEAALALLITVPLVVRLCLPLTTLAVVLAGVAVEAELGGVAGPDFPVFPVVALAVALLAVGSQARWTGLAAAALMTVTVWSVATQLTRPRGSILLGVLVTAGGLLVGRAMRALRFESEIFAQRALALEHERDERASRAVADERRRIARELHDVIGHSISVMGVQAGAVRSVLRADQHRERETLLAVERAGREAVVEMSRLLGLLRADLPEIDSPTPTLRRADHLVAEMRQAGLRVELKVRGDLSEVPPGVDLAGFRILQEALTNVLKHSPAARVSAAVTCTTGHLDVCVLDDGAGAAVGGTGEAGHGLLGMRERSSLYGGQLVARARPEGGFEVHARLPLRAAP
jgi:signal transduction histidine kinase